MYPIAAIAGDKLQIDPRDMSIGARLRLPLSRPFHLLRRLCQSISPLSSPALPARPIAAIMLGASAGARHFGPPSALRSCSGTPLSGACNLLTTPLTLLPLLTPSGFINPFSYQCNLMVYAAGNYNTTEFAISGAPFQLWLLIVASFILAYRNAWQTVWIVSFIVAAGIIVLFGLWTLLPKRRARGPPGPVTRVFCA